MGKVLIFSAPSGSGKTTIVRHLLERFPELEFSISATSRAPRGAERDGVDYYFMDDAEFRARVEQGEFVEWEEVYAGTCYGTLRAEIDRIWDREHVVVFDVDVVGALNIKKLFGDQALSIFIMPPSVEVLRARLEGRGTDSPEAIERRLAKAEQEIAYASKFDRVIVNDDLETAYAEARRVVGDFLAGR
ncbi:guanylate kinase [uncultured Rikenella sp.]|uniref:guanylate kinase n=1 Tax=uncultured Rikenella sp. TaxID=368003 RepID=UPI0026380F8B|nr:guanylate kinase [uncultured Rikenella sp.]